jgi:hypothetical protein
MQEISGINAHTPHLPLPHKTKKVRFSGARSCQKNAINGRARSRKTRLTHACTHTHTHTHLAHAHTRANAVLLLSSGVNCLSFLFPVSWFCVEPRKCSANCCCHSQLEPCSHVFSSLPPPPRHVPWWPTPTPYGWPSTSCACDQTSCEDQITVRLLFVAMPSSLSLSLCISPVVATRFQQQGGVSS